MDVWMDTHIASSGLLSSPHLLPHVWRYNRSYPVGQGGDVYLLGATTGGQGRSNGNLM